MRLSVIVCTRDRPEDLGRCVPTILANDYPDTEVIVVDQSQDDRSRSVVEAAAKGSTGDGKGWSYTQLDLSGAAVEGDRTDPGAYGREVIYCHTDKAGKSRAFNQALRFATGAVILSTDDDCTVPEDWLAAAAATMSNDTEAGIVFGGVSAAPHDRTKIFLPAFEPTSRIRLRGWSGRLRANGLAGANIAIRKDVIDAVGGLDECLGPGCRVPSGEDDDFAYRALSAGFTVVIDPNNAVIHWGARPYADGSARSLLRGHFYGDGATLAKHLRCGDPIAAFALISEGVGELGYLLSNVVRHRRLSGAGRLAYLARGVVHGLRQPLDRSKRLYLSP